MKNICQTERKICYCKYCGCPFEPAPKHPHQKCCKNPECLRIQAREREHRCRKKYNCDPARRMATSQRKHQEYIRRKERKECQKYQVTQPPFPAVIKLREVPDIILGMLQMITQENDAVHLTDLVSRCHESGKALRL